MAKSNKIAILRDAPVGRALVYLALPAVLTSLVNTLHNLIDTVYISQLHDNAMIAATTVALPISTFAQAIGDGIGVGTASYLGRLLGAKDESRVESLIATSITVTFLVSIVACLFSVTLLKPLITIFTNDPAVIHHSYYYLIVLMGFSFFTISKQVLSHMLRAGGDVNYPMIVIVLSIALNIILNPFFMFDFGLGLKVQGAAVATIIAEAFASLALFHRLITKDELLRWKLGHFMLHVPSIKEIINVGIPVFVRSGLSSVSHGFFAKSAGMFGTDFLAASGIARKGEYFARFVIMGVAQGYQPFAAYNYGARNKQRLLSGMKLSMSFTVSYGVAMGLFFMFFPHVFMGWLTDDLTLISLGKNILIGYAFAVPMVGVYQIFAYNFQALGKGKLSFISAVLRQGIVYCPLVVILPRLFGMAGMVVVQPICDWCSALIVFALSKPIFKEIQEME
ncbi:MAG: MATE family efflux transporter [Erysipelotrichaceae bacterium]|nr:MATE family efflux transporter [Erysipelotrichaceae bacterium]